ncbi:hypothetical protein [Brevundimonas sp.]|uniref:hypothetical protein n=1 Tax=Brevundimonas sp. TaxID=1871086 RepID=UPI0035B15510
MNIRMKRDFSYPVPGNKGIRRTLPAGWVGEVEDEVGAAAVEAGAGIDTDEEAGEPEKAEKPKPKPTPKP